MNHNLLREDEREIAESEREFAHIYQVAQAIMASCGRTGEPQIEDLRNASVAIEKGSDYVS